MAMLITKFHRLIQSKLLWIAFLIVVVFSFVIWGTQMPETGSQGPSSAGKLGGKDISFEEFQKARFNTYLSIVLMSGRHVPITPEVDEQLFEMAWQRIATLNEAKKFGLDTSNQDVVNTIHSLEFLHTDGRFNPQAYDQFAQQFLAPMRASKRDFEEHIRQEIILQKFRTILDRMLLVTPIEIKRTFEMRTDVFELEYVKVDTSLVAPDVTISEEDIIAFYQKEPEQFTLSEKVQVKAAIFPIADFIDAADISDTEIEEYYDFNIEQYAIPRDPDEETNVFSIAATEYRPLDEVKEEIRAILTTKEAAILAEAKANEFIQELSARRAAGRSVFDTIAAEWGNELIMVPPFSARQVPAELENGATAARVAFGLSDDDDYYYSDPIVATNYVYVLSLVERQSERIPEYEEVKADVEMMALEFAIYNALTEKAQEIQQSAVAGLSAGLTFEDVLAAYDLSSIKPAAYTLNSTEMDPDMDPALIRAALIHNEGEVTDLVQTEDGIIIGFIKSRKPDTTATVDSLRPQIVSTLRRQSSPVSFNDFQKYLLEKGNFEDNLRRRAVKDTQDADDSQDS